MVTRKQMCVGSFSGHCDNRAQRILQKILIDFIFPPFIKNDFN